MNRQIVIERLVAGHPGWEEWDQLIALARTLRFKRVTCNAMGNGYASGRRLCFADAEDVDFPGWLPSYVPALYGMKADAWDAAGGYADSLSGKPARKGGVFSSAGNDELMGYPLLDVPSGLYLFQSNSSGAVFFIDTALQLWYPNADAERFETLDTLEAFTRTNIQQALNGRRWFEAYRGVNHSLID